MSNQLLHAIEGRDPAIHTALDDLESFLWVLIWGIVHASKDIQGARVKNKGIQRMLDAWQRDNKLKRSAIEIWRDAVFGDLIEEWLLIFAIARRDNRQLIEYLPTIPLDNQQGSEWSSACDRLEAYYTKTYEKILKSGFSHLKNVKRYSTWEEVVLANVPQPMGH